MVQGRTEQEKTNRAPLKVILGGKEYSIAPLVIKYSGEWRKKSLPLIAYLIGWRDKSEEDKLASVEELFGDKTDQIVDSFFEYARFSAKDKEAVETSTTDGEIITAFMEVFNAFVSPLSKAAVTAPRKKAAKKSSP